MSKGEWIIYIVFLANMLTAFSLIPAGVLMLFGQRLRMFVAKYMFAMSWVLGFCLWLWGALSVLHEWGAPGLIIGLLLAGIGVIPLALVALALHHQVAFVDGMVYAIFWLFTRFGSGWLLARLRQKQDSKEQEARYLAACRYRVEHPEQF